MALLTMDNNLLDALKCMQVRKSFVAEVLLLQKLVFNLACGEICKDVFLFCKKILFSWKLAEC